MAMSVSSTAPAPRVGSLPSGPLDAITDVTGVAVGHCTLADGPVQTGATVLLPQPGDLFLHKLSAGADVINGFGKSAGLMQLQELGTLESAIALVGTVAVGTACNALVRDAMAHTPELARSLPTLNPLVLECNDGWLHDTRTFALTEAHVMEALAGARRPEAHGAAVVQGSVSIDGETFRLDMAVVDTQSRRSVWRRSYTAISNIMKTKHDAAKNALNNVR